MPRKIVALMLCVFLVSGSLGCASKKSSDTAGSAAIGAGILGALGAGIGYAIGGKSGALAFGAAGVALGALGGAMYAQKNWEDIEKAQNKSAELDKYLAEEEEFIQQQERDIVTLRYECATADSTTQSLLADYKAKKIQSDELAVKKREYDQRLKAYQDQLEANKNRLANLQESGRPVAEKLGNSQQVDKMKEEIEHLRAANENMEKIIQEYAGYSHRLIPS